MPRERYTVFLCPQTRGSVRYS
ncbi:MAG: DUF1610 domain-containing protein [Clostridia bacterium]|nr:DUF1610 domain-containing protein [Clostridia bacterium]